MSAAANQDPQILARSLITRFFFGSAAVVCALAALALALHERLPVSQRMMIVAGLALLGGFSAIAARLSERSLDGALLALAGGATTMITLVAVVLQWGLNGFAMGLLALITCMICAVSTVRLGVVAALLAATALVALALAEHRHWVVGIAALANAPLWLRLALQLLLLAAGLAGGVLISRVLDHYLSASRDRERRFAGLLAVAADAYWELDPRFNLVLLTRRRDGREFVADELAQPCPPWEMPAIEFADEQQLDKLRTELERRRVVRDAPLRWRSSRGRVRTLAVSGEPRFDRRGVFLGYWGVARDITDEVLARELARAREGRHREIFMRMPNPLVLHRQGRVVDANPAALAMFGWPDLGAMLGQDLLECYEVDGSRESARTRVAELERMPLGASLPSTEFRLRPRGGGRLVVRATGVRVQADDGPATLSIYVDDTERRTAEEAVRRSEAMLSHLVATSPDVITLTDIATGRYAMVNDSFQRLTGYTADDALGRTSLELGLWADPAERSRVFGVVDEHGTVRDQRVEWVARCGRRLTLRLSAARFVMHGRSYAVANAQDVTAIEHERLERDAILQNASIGIAVTRDGEFLVANPAFEQMFGWPPGELPGLRGRLVWPSDEAYAEIGARVGPALSRGEQIEAECIMARRDGSTFLARLLARVVDPGNPGRGGTVWIAEDVTERRQFEAALAKARDDAEAANRAKSAFLANTSHEIRTPLNALVGLARLARQPGVDEARRRQYLEQIFDSAKTLSTLISDILDLSKIEARKLHVETLPFNLRTLLGTLHRGHATIAEARGLTLQMKIDAAVPTLVLGDPVRVRQILGNYLSNALKFTARGGVTLAVRAAAGALVRFEVHDSGPGIDAATQARLFHPFTQADQSTTRRFGGTGLGLSICRELATLMDGSVGVHSEPGCGSMFWAELPLPPSDDRESASVFGALEASPLAGRRVLMVEDNAVNMMIAVAMLQQWGVDVEQASDGHQAFDAVERAAALGRPFDAALMDVEMPVMSGHEATRRLRLAGHALPVIALTAYALTSEREAAIAAGMNDFLTKPIMDERLVHDTLVRAVSSRRA